MSQPPAVVTADEIELHSDLLGTINLPRHELLRFAQGLLGFPECQSFALLRSEREGLYWLQSADYPTLAFLLVDPFLHFPSYKVDLGAAELARVGTSEPADLLVLSIVTLANEREAPCTANLKGPVVINLRDRKAAQVVLADDAFDVREPFSVEAVAA
jgi:flagellar assembly factor FliW